MISEAVTECRHPYNKAGDGPEGPEVRNVSDKLQGHVGKWVNALVCSDKAKIEGLELFCPSPTVSISSYGKKLILQTADYYIVFSLGMSGRVAYEKNEHTHVEFYLDDIALYFNDSRRFGNVEILDYSGLCAVFDKIGPDVLLAALDGYMTFEMFHSCFAKTIHLSKLICDVLTDQYCVSGIGWYLMTEVLHLAHVRPSRPTKEVSEDEWKAIYRNLFEIIVESYQAGGFTLESFVSPDGSKGLYQPRIYGLGEVSGEPVLRVKRSNRTLQYLESSK